MMPILVLDKIIFIRHNSSTQIRQAFNIGVIQSITVAKRRREKREEKN